MSLDEDSTQHISDNTLFDELISEEPSQENDSEEGASSDFIPNTRESTNVFTEFEKDQEDDSVALSSQITGISLESNSEKDTIDNGSKIISQDAQLKPSNIRISIESNSNSIPLRVEGRRPISNGNLVQSDDAIPHLKHKRRQPWISSTKNSIEYGYLRLRDLLRFRFWNKLKEKKRKKFLLEDDMLHRLYPFWLAISLLKGKKDNRLKSTVGQLNFKEEKFHQQLDDAVNAFVSKLYSPGKTERFLQAALYKAYTESYFPSNIPLDIAILESASRIISSNMRYRPDLYPALEYRQNIDFIPDDIMELLLVIRADLGYFKSIGFFCYIANVLYGFQLSTDQSCLSLLNLLEFLPENDCALSVIDECSDEQEAESENETA